MQPFSNETADGRGVVRPMGGPGMAQPVPQAQHGATVAQIQGAQASPGLHSPDNNHRARRQHTGQLAGQHPPDGGWDQFQDHAAQLAAQQQMAHAAQLPQQQPQQQWQQPQLGMMPWGPPPGPPSNDGSSLSGLGAGFAAVRNAMRRTCT